MDNFNMNARRDVTGVDDGLAFFRQTYSFMGIAIIVTAITGFIVQNFSDSSLWSIAGNIIGKVSIVRAQIYPTMIDATFKILLKLLLMAFAVIEGLTLDC